MKVVAVLSVLAAILVSVFGSKASVGGPMTQLFASFVIMLPVAIIFAWSCGLGLLGWLNSIVVAIVGGVTGIVLPVMAFEAILNAAHFQGQLIDTKWAYLVGTATTLHANGRA